jgi:hypothetical protein
MTEAWSGPDSTNGGLPTWPTDFSRDIIPVPCHSHNDYWRHVPLYEALAVGCISVEADIWLTNTGNGTDLRVGHNLRSLDSSRTLQSLYINPLISILEHQNADTNLQASGSVSPVGVFESKPNETVILLLDFKTNGTETWPLVQQQLEPLRQKGWLTYWNATTNAIVPGPLLIVGSGDAPFDLIAGNTTSDNYVFYDAPLADLQDKYNTSNSYYASVSMGKAIGNNLLFGRLSSKQLQTVQTQIKAADSRGLKARYWDTPSWPASRRVYIWESLVNNGAGIINADNLWEVSKFNWSWCVIAGISLC